MKQLMLYTVFDFDGVDITEFSIYKNNNRSSAKVNKLDELALKLQRDFNDTICGRYLPIASSMASGKHYIVLDASSSDANAYSVKVAGGCVYLSGNFNSIENAIDTFYSEVLGCTSGAESGRNVSVPDGTEITGSLGYTVPYTREDLLELMEKAYADNNMIISGQHTYSISDYADTNDGGDISGTRALLESEIGDSAAILGLDVGVHSPYTYWHTGTNTLYENDVSRIVTECMEFVSEGGIITISMHPANPMWKEGDGNWYEGNLGNFINVMSMLSEGTDLNTAFHKTLEPTMDLIKALHENGIPFMFRPFHEMNASWFWWGVDGSIMTETLFKQMWVYLYNYVTEDLGIDDNILWVYSPDVNGNSYNPYPGDAYVDMVGADWYVKDDQNAYKTVFNKIKDKNMSVSLTEFGPNTKFQKKDENGNTYYDYSCMTLLDCMKNMMKNGYGVSYFLAWTRNLSLVSLYDGESFMNDSAVITLDDMPSIWANIKNS